MVTDVPVLMKGRKNNNIGNDYNAFLLLFTIMNNSKGAILKISFISNFLFHNSHDKFDGQIIVSNQINQIES